MGLKAGTWKGSFYLRNKQKDKHKNKYKSTPTLRSTHSGIVVTKKGSFLNIEKPREHRYGLDSKRRIKKPSTFVRANLPTALKGRSSHIRRLK